MKHAIGLKWLANPNLDHSHFPHHFWSAFEYLVHQQSEYSHAHYMVKKIPPIMLTIRSKMVIIL